MSEVAKGPVTLWLSRELVEELDARRDDRISRSAYTELLLRAALGREGE